MISKSDSIERKLLDNIYSGFYIDKLPSEKKIAESYGTTPVTAAKILNRLKDKNIVKRIGGRGTFINPDGLSRKIEINLPFDSKITDEIKEKLREFFPEISFKITCASGNIRRLSESVDITWLTSYFPDSYDKYFSPLPEDLLNELKDEDKYYSENLMIHNYNNSFYGVPIFASPCVFAYNKNLLKKYFSSENHHLTFDDLLELNKKLKNEKTALFDCDKFRKGTVVDIILSQEREKNVNRLKFKNISGGTVINGLNRFKSLYEDSIKKNMSFGNGEAVFIRLCRQSLGDLPDFEFPWDIMPVSFGSAQLSIVASGSLFVFSKTQNKQKLFEVCRAFLSPAIQKIIGKYKYGIPMLKSAALKSMDSREFRDDIFFNEMNNAVLKYELFEKALMNSFIDCIEKFFKGDLSFGDFVSATENICELDCKNAEKRDNFSGDIDF